MVKIIQDKHDIDFLITNFDKIFGIQTKKESCLVVLHRLTLILENWKKSFYCSKVYCT